eukprot:7365098-Pyramimonas_sp.AAC.1
MADVGDDESVDGGSSSAFRLLRDDAMQGSGNRGLRIGAGSRNYCFYVWILRYPVLNIGSDFYYLSGAIPGPRDPAHQR